MSDKKVLIWVPGIDDLFNGEGLVGGLTVQMMHWAKIFKKNNWDVTTITTHKDRDGKELDNLKFKFLKKTPFLNIVFEPLIIFAFILKCKPDLIMCRGASRSLFALSIVCKFLKIKLVLTLASDTDVKKGQELIKRFWDRKLFRLGLSNVKYIVAQNIEQKNRVSSLKKECKVIIIPNIWTQKKNTTLKKENSILWVSNFRKLKRPDWFLTLAKFLPQYNFTIVGKAIDQDLFQRCKSSAGELSNVEFLGGLSFQETEALFTKYKLFLCTSTIEGFPNTFLQSWANGMPVITSFDPSDTVRDQKLGMTFNTISDAQNAITTLLTNNQYYDELQVSIKAYFKIAHDPQQQYKRLIQLIS